MELEGLTTWVPGQRDGNSFRKPHCYGLLTSSDVHDPFVRFNSERLRYDQAGR